MSIDTIVKDAEMHMRKSVESFNAELLRLRTGRAHTGLVEHIKVDYYGTENTLNHVANLSVSDARTITITPWDKSMVKAIEKAIMTSDLGLNPVTDGNIIRIPMPALTEERRKDLVKVVKNNSEQAKVAIRNVRRDANNGLKEMLKAKTISEDDDRRAQENIQKLTDRFIAEIDSMAVAKEKDLMAV
jgi:ribosome recycling factor